MRVKLKFKSQKHELIIFFLIFLSPKGGGEGNDCRTQIQILQSNHESVLLLSIKKFSGLQPIVQVECCSKESVCLQ